MKIVILGGNGKQGRRVAEELSPDFDITIADQSAVHVEGVFDNFVNIDLSDYVEVRKLLYNYDLAVGALPASLGFQTMMAVVDTGINYVDMSFCEQDVLSLNAEAVRKKITVIPDAGVAPGLSNLIVGRAMHTRSLKQIGIYAGGVAANKEQDYVITWSPEDLVAEYTRPARYIEEGKICSTPALVSGLEYITVDGVGEFESFTTDGLRTILTNHGNVPTVYEKTMRWPGHLGALMHMEQFMTDIVKTYEVFHPDSAPDILAVVIRVDEEEVQLVVRHKDWQSAMSRATAYSCASFVRLLAYRKFVDTGVIPPEKLAWHDKSYKFILDNMARHGIEFNANYPYL